METDLSLDSHQLHDFSRNMDLQESATCEYYNAETGLGQGLNPFSGVGRHWFIACLWKLNSITISRI